MSIISRSEAVWKLKTVSSDVNSAISCIREGLWRAGLDAAIEARDRLEAIITHLEEAVAAEPEVQAEATRSSGGLGYRGRTAATPRPPIVERRPETIMPPPTLAP